MLLDALEDRGEDLAFFGGDQVDEVFADTFHVGGGCCSEVVHAFFGQFRENSSGVVRAERSADEAGLFEAAKQHLDTAAQLAGEDDALVKAARQLLANRHPEAAP